MTQSVLWVIFQSLGVTQTQKKPQRKQAGVRQRQQNPLKPVKVRLSEVYDNLFDTNKQIDDHKQKRALGNQNTSSSAWT